MIRLSGLIAVCAVKEYPKLANEPVYANVLRFAPKRVTEVVRA